MYLHTSVASGTDATGAHTHTHTQTHETSLSPVISLVLVYTLLLLEHPVNWCIRNRAAVGPTWSLRDRGKAGMQNNVPFFL